VDQVPRNKCAIIRYIPFLSRFRQGERVAVKCDANKYLW